MDDVFRILSNNTRRRLLVSLLDHFEKSDRPFSIPDDIHVEATEDVRKIHVEMVHQHCPMLEAAGAILWDPKTHEIAPGPRFEEIRQFLELLDEHATNLPGSESNAHTCLWVDMRKL